MNGKKKQIITHWEESQMIKRLVEKYSRDETIVALNSRIKEVELENGILKSTNAELEFKLKQKIDNSNKNKLKNKIKESEQKVRDLEWQLVANNVPLPKKYL